MYLLWVFVFFFSKFVLGVNDENLGSETMTIRSISVEGSWKGHGSIMSIKFADLAAEREGRVS